MSLYDVLFKRHHAAPNILWHGLKLDFTKIGRLRDCYPVQPPLGEVGLVHVLTRTGGGNRQDYVEQDNYLRASPYYVEDYDDEYDSTYAHFVFKEPTGYEVLRKLYEKMRVEQPEELDSVFYKQTLRERFEAAIASILDPTSAEGQRILGSARPLFDQITNAINSGSPAIVAVDGDALRNQYEERQKKH